MTQPNAPHYRYGAGRITGFGAKDFYVEELRHAIAVGIIRANRHRATAHQIRQYRYIYFLKKAARRDLRLRPQAYPKPDA